MHCARSFSNMKVDQLAFQSLTSTRVITHWRWFEMKNECEMIFGFSVKGRPFERMYLWREHIIMWRKGERGKDRVTLLSWKMKSWIAAESLALIGVKVFQDCYKYVTISLRVYFSLFLVVTLCVCIEFSRWKIIFVLILYIMEHWRNEKRRISKVMKYNIFIFYRMHCFRWVWMETLLDLSWSKTREGVMGLI